MDVWFLPIMNIKICTQQSEEYCTDGSDLYTEDQGGYSYCRDGDKWDKRDKRISHDELVKQKNQILVRIIVALIYISFFILIISDKVREYYENKEKQKDEAAKTKLKETRYNPFGWADSPSTFSPEGLERLKGISISYFLSGVSNYYAGDIDGATHDWEGALSHYPGLEWDEFIDSQG